jgi:hypothetical protein
VPSAVDGSDLRVLWHAVERACQGGLAERYGVDAARLVATRHELPLFQLAAVVDLAECRPAPPGEAGGGNASEGVRRPPEPRQGQG